MNATMVLLTVMLGMAQAPEAELEIGRESFEVWLCPVHRDEQGTGPGTCPICQRAFVERLLVSSYSCPMHTHIDRDEPGTCNICYMDLVAMTRELQWYCPDDPREVRYTPGGVCSTSGAPMVPRTVPMAHGDHNPRHGGILFMAPDRYHHLEGVLSPEGEFRLYFYDDFTEPMDAAEFVARVGDTRLTPADDGAYATASLPPPRAYPAEVALHIRFPRTEEDARFDFVFVEDMGDPAAELRDFVIPASEEAIYRAILERDDYLKTFMSRGAWQDIHVPALQAKDLTLALIEQDGDRYAIPGKKIVQAAWLLDIFGDEGNRERVESSYALFRSALTALEIARDDAP